MHQYMIKTILHLFSLISLLFVPCISTTKYICNPQDSCGCSAQPVIISQHDTYETAPPNSWDWIVSLHDSNGHFCDGSILNEFYVITAAHCLQETADGLSDISIGRGREHHVIDSFIRFPTYNEETFENNIALIRVRTPFNFTDPNTARICLPDDHFPGAMDVVAVSWTAKKLRENQLKQMRMQIVDQSRNTYKAIRTNHRERLHTDALNAGKTA